MSAKEKGSMERGGMKTRAKTDKHAVSFADASNKPSSSPPKDEKSMKRLRYCFSLHLSVVSYKKKKIYVEHVMEIIHLYVYVFLIGNLQDCKKTRSPVTRLTVGVWLEFFQFHTYSR